MLGDLLAHARQIYLWAMYIHHVRSVGIRKVNFRPMSLLDSLNTGDDVDVNMLLTSRKKSSEVKEGLRDTGLSADIWVTRARMSRDERIMLRVLRSYISPCVESRRET
jgi:hypothetical protein